MKGLLSDPQLDKLSDILITTGQVFFGSIVIPFIFGLDKAQPTMLLSGLVLTFSSWIASLLVIKGINIKGINK